MKKEKMIVEKFKCQACGRITAGRMPQGGDGMFYYPRRHNGADGYVCEGVYDEAISVQVDINIKNKPED